MSLQFTEVTVPAVGNNVDQLRDICDLGAHGFAAVGDNGLVYTSADGQTWVKRTAAEANNWKGLAFDGITLVAVASNGTHRVMTSADFGATWVAVTAAEANQWEGVTATGTAGHFVAVAGTGTHRVMRSTDSGSTWSTITAAAALPWASVVYASDLSLLVSVAASGGNIIQTSGDDGLTWTQRTTPAGVTLSGVASGSSLLRRSVTAGIFVFTSINGGVRSVTTSANGTSGWTERTIPDNADGLGGLIVGVTLNVFALFKEGGSNRFDVSTNGTSWSASDTGGFHQLWDCAAWNETLATGCAWDNAGTNTMLVLANPSVTSLSPDHGPKTGGTVVTITGTALSGVTSVTFDGVAATSVSVLDYNHVSCMAPAHAIGPVDVIAVGVGTLTQAYSYVSVERVSPKKGTAAGGDPVTITGFGFTAATGVLFDASPATDVVIVDNRTITCTTPAHRTGIVDVTVSGVGVGLQLFTYQLVWDLSLGPVSPLPPLPTGPITGADGRIAAEWQRWLAEAKKRMETAPKLVAEQVTGEFDPGQIPGNMPWSKIDKAGSSLADLTTRSAADLASGILLTARMPALTGDVTTVEGAVAATLAASGAAAGTYGDATHVAQVTVDAKGRVTAASNVAVSGGGGGKIAQVVNTETGATASGTTGIPIDDTIPQNTEGDQYLSLAITPTDAANKLLIEVTLFCSGGAADTWLIAALFQDTTAGALAAGTVVADVAFRVEEIRFAHYMTAGTTSPTTFKVRAGKHTGAVGTFVVNGNNSGRLLGGVLVSSLTITEIVP